MKRGLLLIVCYIIAYINIYAKTFVINNIEYIENDLTGSVQTIVDKNGKACAVLKIRIPEMARFSGDIYGDIHKNGNEYILYISSDSKQLKIYPNNGNTLDVDLTAYPCYPYSPKLSYGVQIVTVSDDVSGSNLDYLSNDELLKLANQDNAEACFQIGCAYYLGNRGYEVDHRKGKEWVMRAANLGDIMAQCELGKIYLNGDEFTSKDYDKAYYWIEKSARNNNGNAQFLMASQYWRDINNMTDKDMELAKYWLNKSASNGYMLAKTSLSFLYIKEENYNEAIVYAKESALDGNPMGQYLLGSLYSFEDTEFYDLKKSGFWMELAAEGGFAQAQNELGELYESSADGKNSINEAVFWYKEAAKNGDKDAKSALKRIEK